MLKTKLYHKLLIAGITGSLLISSGVVAFAATTKSSNTPSSKIACKVGGEKKDVGNSLTSILAKQVTAGTITQSQADAITSYLTTKQAAEKVARDAEKAKVAAMTDAEKKAYFEANKSAKTDLIADLVTAKLLTQSQADTIKAAMPQGHEGGKRMGKGHIGGAMKGTTNKGATSSVTKQ